MISVSYLKSVYDKKKTVELLNDIDDINYIHLDLMDGSYVKDDNYDFNELKEIFKSVSKEKDIHLMISEPLKYIEDLSTLKPSIITVHPDACENPRKVIDAIKEKGIKVGLAINYDIDVEQYENLYKYADVILVMSVQAGEGGQEFKKDVLSKIEYFTTLLDELSAERSKSEPYAVKLRIATMACKAAVKGNMRMSVREADALIDEMLTLENPYNCPHGRPTVVSFSRTELEKMFKRIVS